MKMINDTLGQLYLAVDESVGSEAYKEHVSNAIDILNEHCNELSCNIAISEVIEIIHNLQDDGDLTSIVYELEVMSNQE